MDEIARRRASSRAAIYHVSEISLDKFAHQDIDYDDYSIPPTQKWREFYKSIAYSFKAFLLRGFLPGISLFAKRKQIFENVSYPILTICLLGDLVTLIKLGFLILAFVSDEEVQECDTTGYVFILYQAIEPFIFYFFVVVTFFMLKQRNSFTFFPIMASFSLLFRIHQVIETIKYQNYSKTNIILNMVAVTMNAITYGLILDTKIPKTRVLQTSHKSVAKKLTKYEVACAVDKEYTFDVLQHLPPEEQKQLEQKCGFVTDANRNDRKFTLGGDRRMRQDLLEKYLMLDAPQTIHQVFFRHLKPLLVILIARGLLKGLARHLNILDENIEIDRCEYWNIFSGYNSSLYYWNTWLLIDAVLFSQDLQQLTKSIRTLSHMIDPRTFVQDKLKIDLFCPKSLQCWNVTRQIVQKKTKRLSMVLDIMLCLILGWCLTDIVSSILISISKGSPNYIWKVAGNWSLNDIVKKSVAIFIEIVIILAILRRTSFISSINRSYEENIKNMSLGLLSIDHFLLYDQRGYEIFYKNQGFMTPEMQLLAQRCAELGDKKITYLNHVKKTLQYLIHELEIESQVGIIKFLGIFKMTGEDIVYIKILGGILSVLITLF